MGLFDWLGWSRRAPRPVGTSLETGGHDAPSGSSTRQWLIRGGLFLAILFVGVVAFPRGELYEYAVQVGDTWQQSTLEAPFDFPIYVDQDEVQARRDTVRKSTPPYFREVTNARQKMASNRDTLARQLDRALKAYAAYRYHRSQGEMELAQTDSVQYVRHRRNALVTLRPAHWETLAQEYAHRVQGQSVSSQESEEQDAPRLDRQLLDEAFQVGAQLLNAGVMDLPQDSVQTGTIVIRNENEQVQRTVEKSSVFGLEETYHHVRTELQDRFSENPEHAQIAFSLFRAIFQPSLQYMRGATMKERNRRAQNVTAIQGGVEEGEVIVRQGERVTAEAKQKLTSLERVRNEQMASPLPWKQVLGQMLLAGLGFVFFFFYLFLFRPDIWRSNRDIILTTLILGVIVALFGVIARIDWINLYAVPVALASVLLTIVFNSRIGLFGTLVLAFMGGQILGMDLEYTLATFFGGAFGIFSVRDIKNRGQFFLSAGLVFTGYLLVLVGSWLYLGTPIGRLGQDLLFAGIGACFTITASLFLWTVERAFDITTDLTLLELSDTNNQLLKELSLQAPGSFNHSLQVANLAEAAADRVGAHSLLTRVGALYHDIGKMIKPEYFVENQRTGMNPHDRLKPRMSALIIASHVKEGLEMGKEYSLPEEVLKFIPTHHGTARIEYFYRKALTHSEENDANDASVLESEFRYPGPKPDSKETGILMLADSVEAASRSLDDPSHERLKSLIDLIFRERIDDGQLDKTDLTFQDLQHIKDTFLKMLLGIYHVRMKYPDQEVEDAEEEHVLQIAPQRGPYADVTVLLQEDPWPRVTPVESEDLSPVVSRRNALEPRPELAEASPHSRSDQKKKPSQASPDIPFPDANLRPLPEGSERSGDGENGTSTDGKVENETGDDTPS